MVGLPCFIRAWPRLSAEHEQGTSHRTGLDCSCGALLALGCANCCRAAGLKEPPAWSQTARSPQQACRCRADRRQVRALEVITPTDSVLVAKAPRPARRRPGLAPRVDPSGPVQTWPPAAVAAALPGCVLKPAGDPAALERGKAWRWPTHDLVVAAFSLALAGYLAGKRDRGLRLAERWFRPEAEV